MRTSWRWALALALGLCFILSAAANDTANENNDNDDKDNIAPSVVVLFMFFGLGTGIVIMQILSLIGDPIPYTCVVFLAGILFSMITRSDGLMGQSITEWSHIDADLLLFVFLPPLIFGEAMSLNFYHVKGGLMQALILAGPGVLLGAGLMGLIAKFMLPYNWSWQLAMTFGSILSATDPVAVVALLKSAGASPKLTILIVGESLLNDGTAMVLFEIFYQALNGRHYTVGSVVSFFLAAAFGSVLLGMAFGLAAIRWMRTANRPLKDVDTTIQIAITIACSYLVFFTAQWALEISGVLACCGAGIIFSKLAPPLILSHETMHNVWGMIEWGMNTMIFLLAGLIIGKRVIGSVHTVDWFYMVALYLLLMVVRSTVILLLYPFFGRIGHQCTRNEAVFMAWAGLRGALGMTLALLVERNCPDDIAEETSRLFFYVGGIAALTLIINAPTASYLLVVLGLLGNDSAEKSLVMNQIKKRLRRRMDRVLLDMASEFNFTPQDLDEVRVSCSLLAGANMDVVYRESEMMRQTDRASMGLASGGVGGMGGMGGIGQGMGGMGGMGGRSSTSALAPGASESALLQAEDDYDDAMTTDTPASSLFSSRPLRRHSTGTTLPAQQAAVLVQEQALQEQREEQEREALRIATAINAQDLSFKARPTSNTSNTSNGGGGGSGGAARRHSHGLASNMRADDLVRALSMNRRGAHPLLTPDLLSYVRSIFLEIVRVRYWHDIERGKLPRLSHSAQFLLYSVEVAADENDKEARDWEVIRDEITTVPLSVRLLSYIDSTHIGMSSTYYLGKLEARREKRAVYMLTSFIEAQEHAQAKVHEFVVEDDDEVHVKSPEELKVIAESQAAVAVARNLLDAMSPQTVSEIRAKQVVALVLTKQAQMVKKMMGEGLLTPQHAEEILEEIGLDLQRMEKDRNRMYLQHGEAHGKRRQALRIEEIGRGGRGSLFSVFSQSESGGNGGGYGGGGGGGGGDRSTTYLYADSEQDLSDSPLMQH